MGDKFRHKVKHKEDSFRTGYQPLYHGGIAVVSEVDKKHTGEVRIKNCLTCGAEHYHNNSFCSANCHRTYKQTESQ